MAATEEIDQLQRVHLAVDNTQAGRPWDRQRLPAEQFMIKPADLGQRPSPAGRWRGLWLFAVLDHQALSSWSNSVGIIDSRSTTASFCSTVPGRSEKIGQEILATV